MCGVEAVAGQDAGEIGGDEGPDRGNFPEGRLERQEQKIHLFGDNFLRPLRHLVLNSQRLLQDFHPANP